MNQSNERLTHLILGYLDDIELDPRPHVDPKRCREYVDNLRGDKPLSCLHKRTLKHLLNMFDGILGR